MQDVANIIGKVAVEVQMGQERVSAGAPLQVLRRLDEIDGHLNKDNFQML